MEKVEDCLRKLLLKGFDNGTLKPPLCKLSPILPSQCILSEQNIHVTHISSLCVLVKANKDWLKISTTDQNM